MKNLIYILGILLFVVRVEAGMVRVVDVLDGRTLVVERDGVRETVRLAGIAVLDETRATELLRWNVVSTWVMAEPRAGGGHLVYRSPDALFVNRELVMRGYARATEFGIEPDRNLVVTYLGTIDPPAAPLTATTARQTSSGTSRRSTASRSPRARAAGSKAAGSGSRARKK